MRINISPHQLRAVLAVAADNSFTSAASKLGLSQPALSRIVRSVEEELGCAIFDRDTRNVRPTRAGITMLAIIKTALIDYETALERLRDDALGRSGIVRVATLPSLAQTLLAPAMAEMRARAPDIEIRIRDGLSETVLEQVISGDVDLGLVDRPAGYPSIEFHELIRDRVGLVWPRRRSARRGAHVRLDGVRAAPVHCHGGRVERTQPDRQRASPGAPDGQAVVRTQPS